VVAHGRVQGVWFRDGVRRQAERLGVSGWVRNRPDGAVEAELEGPSAPVDAVVRWFSLGPPDAQVDRLEVVEIPTTGQRGFSVLPSTR
jgi:acylphosphatase